MNRCKDPRCAKVFVPKTTRQVYCSYTCKTQGNHFFKSKEQLEAHRADVKKYKMEHPEKTKISLEKSKKRNYADGKLPPWMYS